MMHGRCLASMAVLGLAMGFLLSRIGFSDFGEVHRMFLFRDLRLTLTFAVAVAGISLGYRVLGRGLATGQRPHPGTVPGGLMLGAGWALTGACPAIVWVQLGEGRVGAVATLAGVIVGVAIYPRLHARLFRWPLESCQG